MDDFSVTYDPKSGEVILSVRGGFVVALPGRYSSQAAAEKAARMVAHAIIQKLPAQLH
ncbi:MULTISPECIES: hypothetical protein [unclassified Neorhizobium]|uniref:hypothetical protein n=1 Tax=unclassified Neorhizobium TaxID=2629175 RepID=UPI001FF56F8F|nr:MULTISPECIES: hypothetical protein [unclassified Neorhizobium]MCJ9673288.1 hypothetical protein [Neorhizobium sp. SHOUNA12B]MCJ9748670.1 hypothetical protein [Neorhizobium sp. SHOUNA12A]